MSALRTVGQGIWLFWALAAALAHARTYEVGPGRELESLAAVPWNGLRAGDLVEISFKPQPYAEGFAVSAQGTAENPVVIRGMPGPNGEQPRIGGAGVRYPSGIHWEGQERAIVKIGSESEALPAHVRIENLDIGGAEPGNSFTIGDGSARHFLAHASAVWIQSGNAITIRGCTLHDSANGLFASHSAADVRVEHCSLYGNGLPGSTQQHNSYTEAAGITFEFNHYGPLRPGAAGNALKDRSAGTVIRYNWIEGGGRLLDLVDSGYDQLRRKPEYDTVYVYGNVLEKAAGGTNQICHFGGDSGELKNYRRGPLYFYHNTVIAREQGLTVLFRMPTPNQRAFARNNIVHLDGAATRLALKEGGTIDFSHNWLPAGWCLSAEGETRGWDVVSDNLDGAEPGFLDFRKRNYTLRADRRAALAAAPLPTVLKDQPVQALPPAPFSNYASAHAAGQVLGASGGQTNE